MIAKVKNTEKVNSMSYEERLTELENEHLRFQPEARLHIYVHWKMFLLALRFRVWSEALGQISRLFLAAPGSLLGKAPKGNVGSTRMGIFEVKED